MGQDTTLHVAKRVQGGWKVLQQGAATASCYRPTKQEAIEAALTLAASLPQARIKIHREDNTVEREIGPTELPEQAP